ncbi:hypothetical protein BH23BAC3_BH23BAC3_31780 [soil metagenome]
MNVTVSDSDQSSACLDKPFGSGIYSEEKTDSDPIIRYGGNHAILTIAKVSDHTFEITLAPLETIHSSEPELPESDVLIEYEREQLWKSRTIMDPVRGNVGDYILEVLRSPLRIILRNEDNSIIQQLKWPDSEDGRMEFPTNGDLYGFDLDGTQTGGQGVWYSVRDRVNSGGDFIPVGVNQSPVIAGEDGWAILFYHPARDNKMDLKDDTGLFLPNSEALNSPLQLFLTLWDDPQQILSEYSLFAGESLLLPLQSSNVEQLFESTENSQ